MSAPVNRPVADWITTLAALDEETLRVRCRDLPPPEHVRIHDGIENPRAAATVVPVIDGPEGLEIIVTRRPDTMTYHRNDWVFPGGRVDVEKGESTAEAAVRELGEELGVPAASVDLVGQLHSYGPIVTGFVIHSYVGLIERGTPIEPDPGEVAEIRRVPLADLVKPGCYRVDDVMPDHDTGPAADGSTMPSGNKTGHRLRFFELAPGEDLWGTQADILLDLLTHLAPGVFDESPA